LTYNIGETAFKTSTLLAKLNKGDLNGAADQFAVWNKGGGQVLKGLVRRRAAERELFLKK
jgi:lysozyme